MTKKRLLIIEDDPAVCQSLKRMAEFSDFEVIATDTEITFYAQLVLFRPDVIIIDLHIPGQDSIELIRQLADLNHSAHLVIVSGLDKRVLVAAAQTATELGLSVLGILQKPVPLSRIRQLLTLYLSLSAKRTSRASRWQDQLDNAQWMPTQEDLIHVIEKDLLTLHYQPILDCRTGSLIGFEALARWDIPDKGSVTPDVFVPLAESGHLISLMTSNIARQGIRWLKRMQSTDYLSRSNLRAGFSQQALTLSLNISAKSLEDLVRIPAQSEHLFRPNVNTDSGRM